jgi:hypothetical protein
MGIVILEIAIGIVMCGSEIILHRLSLIFTKLFHNFLEKHRPDIRDFCEWMAENRSAGKGQMLI